ncbi:MAG: LicD family protein [Fibrobacter sp.]|nr:LicD family protein [Fibrobacter sp.]
MKKIEQQECREIQMSVLDEIDRICKENNLKYSLAYGTLLGAVRHKGYIAWDDDIDICLLR